MKTYAVLDFETASAINLKKCGAAVYARHPTTEILTLGLSVGGGAPIYITPADLHQPDKFPSLLRMLVDDPQARFVCHGAQFERNIWTHIMVAQLGWPELPLARWHDTQAVAFMKGLPGKLEILTKLLNLPEQKDAEGSRFTIALSKPNKKTGMLDRSPEAYARVGQYVLSDCVAENQLLLVVGGFDGNERAVWELDQKINDRGVKIDRAYVNAGINICERVVPMVVNQFRDLTGCAPTQRDKVMKWLVDQGLKLKDLRKETIEKLLGEAEDAEVSLSDQDTPSTDEELQLALDVGIPPQCKTALRWRGLTTSASVKKLPTMLGVMCPEDDRARGLLQYHGAGPGRWAGRILQPHNFPRGFAHDIDDLVGGILAEDVDYLTAVYGNPIEAVSTGLRHAIVAGGDDELHLGDFTQVEARVVLALAGATNGLEAFMRGKPYVEMAESIFKQKVDKHQNIREYTIGKNTILGCGFQMGAKTFRTRYCPSETPEFAQRAIDTYRKDFAPEVVDLWYGLERAALEAVWENRPCEAYGVLYERNGAWLTARLPSGRKLWYYGPQPVRKAMPWDKNDIRPAWTSLAYKTGRLIRRDMYGGLLTENVVQGLARDLLVEAMFRCEREGLKIVLTVHDEIVDESKKPVKLLEQCMTERSRWAEALNIPIGVELASGQRYRK